MTKTNKQQQQNSNDENKYGSIMARHTTVKFFQTCEKILSSTM